MMDLIKTSLGTLTATGNGDARQALPGQHLANIVVSGTGAVSAAGSIQGTNDLSAPWKDIGAFSISGTDSAAGTVSWSLDYLYWRLVATGLTGSKVSAIVASESLEKAGGLSTALGADGIARLDDVSRGVLRASGYSGWGKQIRVIAIGDSITAYGSASGWMLYVEMVANGRVKLVRDAAIAGNRTDQMVARFSTDVTPYASQADELWVMTGANDATAGDTSATFASDLSQLVDLGLSVGLRVRVFAMPPNDTSIANALKFREITGAVAIKKGVDFYDPWQTCVNPATGGFLAADTIDGVHPSAAGHTKAGQAVVAALAIPTTHNIALPVQNAANGGMMTNPLFVTDTNADGAADGWGFSGGGVPSLVAGTFGNKQRFTATALTGPTYIQNNPILTVVPGNVYSVKGKLTVSGTDHNWYLRIRWQTSASIDTGNLYPWNGQANATGEFEFLVTAPADATKLAVQFSLLKQAAKPSFSAVLDVEQFQIVDLTAIGLG